MEENRMFWQEIVSISAGIISSFGGASGIIVAIIFGKKKSISDNILTMSIKSVITEQLKLCQ